MGVLDGIRVLDFGTYIAGPYCAALLADLGAEVIRVDRVGGSEDRWVSPVTADGTGAVYLQCNRGKRGITLDLTKPAGRDVLTRLVATSDVVVANLPVQALRSTGLDYETLRAIKSDIIVTTLNAWGSGGEWSDKVGFEALAQAASGQIYLTGPPGSPSRAVASHTDFSTGMLAAMATLAALMHRMRTGAGQLIEAALLRTALTSNSTALIEESMLGLDRESIHNRGHIMGPSDLFRTRDGWIMCTVIGSPQFRRWTEMIDRRELFEDRRFQTDASRGEHGAALSAYMGAWCADRTTDECLSAMAKFKVPGGPVLSPREALELPHTQQIRAFEPVGYPTASKPVPLVAFPVVMSALPGRIRCRAPQVGEHTDAVLSEIGYDAAGIVALRRACAV